MSKEEDTFTRVFVWVLAALVLFTIIVMLVARTIGLDRNSGPMADRDIYERTKPFGRVRVSTDLNRSTVSGIDTVPPAGDIVKMASGNAEGQVLYEAACIACHGTGVAGAPVLGDSEAWKQRLAGGLEAMVVNAIKGKGLMPPKGNRSDYTDSQIRKIVDYMMSSSR